MQPISRFPIPELSSLPQDIQQMLHDVQEKAGFIPNVFITLAHRPDELRAFFAYHEAVMSRPSGLIGGGSRYCTGSFEFLDSPNSTSALTYSAFWRKHSGTMYLNRTWDSGWFHGASSLTVYEVSA